jgi:hypothetical protein
MATIYKWQYAFTIVVANSNILTISETLSSNGKGLATDKATSHTSPSTQRKSVRQKQKPWASYHQSAEWLPYLACPSPETTQFSCLCDPENQSWAGWKGKDLVPPSLLVPFLDVEQGPVVSAQTSYKGNWHFTTRFFQLQTFKYFIINITNYYFSCPVPPLSNHRTGKPKEPLFFNRTDYSDILHWANNKHFLPRAPKG